MEINGITVVKYCRYCEAIIDNELQICPFCSLDTSYPLLEKYSEISFEQVKNLIDDAFFRLENYMNGKLNGYLYFGFNDAFTKLFFEAKKPENGTFPNFKLIGKYSDLAERIRIDFDKSDFKNTAAYENEDFCKDCEEITYLSWNRDGEFIAFLNTDEIEEIERKISITDILKTKPLPPQSSETKTKQETPTFINNFDKIAPTAIYKHFKAGLVDKGYLSEQELNEYLKAAFELKTIPETLFKIKDAPKKVFIEAVFYTYYKNVAGKIHGRQNQYAALLGDYFEGYKTTTVISNFSKSVY